jgi:putative ABC transport system ATP-binding protein
MITTANLSRSFTTQGATVQAVRNVSFSLEAGQLAAVVGKSGSGKSTLLALLGALDVPTEGTIAVDGQSVSDLRGRSLLRYRRSTVGFVFQNYNLIPNLSALENVMLPLEFAGKRNGKSRAEHLLKQVGLTGDKLKRTPGRLSGGEQQRVAIARALANKPRLILADEPTGNLDQQTSATIVDLLRDLARTEKTIIIVVTHDQAIAGHADRMFTIQDGRLSEARR